MTLKLSSTVVGYSNDENKFPHKFILTNTQISMLFKVLANNFSTNIKLSKTQLLKTEQWEKILDKLLKPLIKTGLSLVKNALKLLSKSVLIPLGLTVAAVAAAAIDAAIQKKIFGSGMITFII